MSRQMTERLVSDLPYDAVPEMVPPQCTVLTKPPMGYTRDLEMRLDAPYFNASLYCNHIGLRFSLWLRHPATIALLKALSTYYREASHERAPSLVMLVKGGARSVRGYYLHISLQDALSSWCDFESLPLTSRPRMPSSAPIIRQANNLTLVYTTQTVINPGASPEIMAAAQAGAQSRISSVISAARGGAY